MGSVGCRFPFSTDPAYGRIQGTDYAEMIRQSVQLIVATRKGERFIHPDFGCGIHDFVFHGADYTTLKRIENEVVQSLTKWEPRISSLVVHAMLDTEAYNQIHVEISYAIPKLDAFVSQVYILK